MNEPLDATHWGGADLDRLLDAAERIAPSGTAIAVVSVVIHGERLQIARFSHAARDYDYCVLEPVGPRQCQIFGWPTATDLLSAIDRALPPVSAAVRERRLLAEAIATGRQPRLPLRVPGEMAL